MTKTDDVMNLLEESEKSTAEIMKETGCSKGLVSQCRRKIKAADNDEEADNDLATDEELNTAYNGIRKVSITPDPKTLTENTVAKKEYYVECGSCGHEWSVSSNEHIASCPACGVDLG